MAAAEEDVARLAALYAGYDAAYGKHGAPDQRTTTGKQPIKATARTVRAPVTPELWTAHVAGAEPLGIIPIRADGTCSWGCIDVDVYDMRLEALVAEVEQYGWPLVVCRSKSGGGHVFLFLREPSPAADVVAWLTAAAAAMGRGQAEIFPKQTEILAERGDTGNWLNMPYLGGDATERYCVKPSGFAMTLGEFLDYAEGRRVSLRDLPVPRAKAKKTVGPRAADNSGPMAGAPPCLQHLTGTGFPDGTRNSGLFALGVFAQKKFGSEWRSRVREFNQSFMVPPLPDDEVETLIGNLGRKEYNYQCKAQPCVSYCDAGACRRQEFGVGQGENFPNLSDVSVLGTDERLWFVNVDGHRVVLTTRQFKNYSEFTTVCFETHRKVYFNMKQNEWIRIIAPLVESAVVIDMPEDVSASGQFMELLEEFLNDRHRAQAPEGILNGKPYYDDEAGRHLFKLSHLAEHLEKRGFRTWGRNMIGSKLREIGGDFFQFWGKNRNIKCWQVPASLFEGHAKEPLPPGRRDPI
jgi:hypothetical protein